MHKAVPRTLSGAAVGLVASVGSAASGNNTAMSALGNEFANCVAKALEGMDSPDQDWSDLLEAAGDIVSGSLGAPKCGL